MEITAMQLIFGVIGLLITMLSFCVAVIGFVWKVYKSIEDRHTQSSIKIHERLNEIFERDSRRRTAIALLNQEVGVNAPSDE